ncbi:hypothetical protein COT47_01325, partial [Candidatus Woesearchaeota archaeon CG08_land_8_20_14_0_20_43_7]
PFGELAKLFFQKYEQKDCIFYYSGFIIKELRYILDEICFNRKRQLFYDTPNFQKVIVTDEDYRYARKIEPEIDFDISFYDIMHMILSKRLGAILVTRDNKLLGHCKSYGVIAAKPEEL